MKYYNSISKGYDELHKEEQLKKVNLILKHLKPKGLLLDVGAGSGISTKPFEKYCRCIALDPSIELLKQYKGTKVLGKAESIPFPDKTFDVIISITALHHTNLKKALSEIKRVAKPNAKIAISFLKKSKKLNQMKKLLKNFKQIEEEKDMLFIGSAKHLE
ncbi:class I SAM-dependent methyltransferase [Candidatus Woesearchaeota archaeon]|nr:class I SAM-dependent methyltransferase [Candidatus Woesearchaeota archaeon]